MGCSRSARMATQTKLNRYGPDYFKDLARQGGGNPVIAAFKAVNETGNEITFSSKGKKYLIKQIG